MRGGSFGVVFLFSCLAVGCGAEESDAGAPAAPDARALPLDAETTLPDAAGVLPDSAVVLRDAAVAAPDAVVTPQDAGSATADAEVVPPDAAAVPPDAAVVPTDAAVVPPDAAVVPPDAGPPTLGTVTPADLFAALPGDDLLLIDVHVPYAGELPNTDTHIVYTDTAALMAYIGPARDTPVVLYCLTDHMSLIAGDALVAEGYRGVRSLAGGMRAWEAAGYPLEHRP